ncbi:MAG: HAD-IA family hydrolase [Anaerolineales bacterium]|nr:HAD-IA family hydrolase [Anaerolineales bacterium]
MNKIRASILDLDGVMIDSEPISLRAWQELLSPYGRSLTEDDYQLLIGHDADTAARFIQGKMNVGLTVEDIINQHEQLRMDIIKDEAEPIEGLFDLLAAFHSRKLLTGVASNSRSTYVHYTLDTIGLGETFNCVISSDQVDNGKPAPDLYLAAARCLEIEPAMCLAIEDSSVGLESALAAGMHCVVVTNGENRYGDFSGAYSIYNSLMEITEDVDRII